MSENDDKKWPLEGSGLTAGGTYPAGAVPMVPRQWDRDPLVGQVMMYGAPPPPYFPPEISPYQPPGVSPFQPPGVSPFQPPGVNPPWNPLIPSKPAPAEGEACPPNAELPVAAMVTRKEFQRAIESILAAVRELGAETEIIRTALVDAGKVARGVEVAEANARNLSAHNDRLVELSMEHLRMSLRNLKEIQDLHERVDVLVAENKRLVQKNNRLVEKLATREASEEPKSR